MPTCMRCCLCLLILSVTPRMEALAQAPEQRDQPKILVRARPLTQPELDRRRALTLYGLGMMRVKEDRLVEATHVLEDALELDAESAAIQKALIPLYLAFGRTADAVQACKRTLDLDPGDHDTWSVYARQLKNLGKL